MIKLRIKIFITVIFLSYLIIVFYIGKRGLPQFSFSHKIIPPPSIQNLYNLISKYRITNYNKTILCIDSLLNESQRLKFDQGLAKAYYAKGYLFVEYTKQYPEALTNYNMAIPLYEKVKDKKGLAECYTAIGTVYYLNDFYDRALLNYSKALNLWKSIDNKEQQANVYRGLGLTYRDKQEHDKAIESFNHTLSLRTELKDQKGIADACNDLGIIYMYKHHLNQAIDYYIQGISIAEDLEYKEDLANLYNNIAAAYKEQENYSLASKYYFKSLEIDNKTSNKLGEIKTCYNIGITKLALNKPQEALLWLSKGEDIAKLIHDKKMLASISESLVLVYKELGKLSDALLLTKKYLYFKKEIQEEKINVFIRGNHLPHKIVEMH